MSEWFRDENFWTNLFVHMFPEERFLAGKEEVENALNLTGLQRGSVLDLCCGPGRHAIPLAKRGFQVTAVDRTPFLLNKAKERAAAAGVSIEFVLEDMIRFVRPSAFDLAINLHTSFGYFENVEDDLQALRNVRQSLKPGGALLIDVRGKEGLARNFQPTISQEAPDGSILVQRTEIVDDWTRVKNHWVLIKEGSTKEFRFLIRIYSGQELRDLLADAGFKTVELYKSLDGSPYDLNAVRLVALARKAA